jgi:hypothetical protein
MVGVLSISVLISGYVFRLTVPSMARNLEKANRERAVGRWTLSTR